MRLFNDYMTDYFIRTELGLISYLELLEADVLVVVQSEDLNLDHPRAAAITQVSDGDLIQ